VGQRPKIIATWKGVCGDFLSIFVKKADGTRQTFEREKIVRTCLRMGASVQVASQVADKVEARIYDGISTAAILQMILRFMRRQKPDVRNLFDLRKGLSLMVPKPEFEVFVRSLLSSKGFEVSPNELLVGKCVLHEVDGIAKRGGVTYFVEAKHHVNYHALTGLDESRIARAILEDVGEGFALGRSGSKIDGAMIVTNTRYSDEALQYGSCRGILQIGWSSPAGGGLQNLIDGMSMFPLSCLKGVGWDARVRLADSGVVLFGQIASEDAADLARRTGLPLKVVKDIKEKIVPYA
jgi:ATP cone domain/Restriction endonuclease